MKSSVGVYLVIWIEKVFIIDCHEKNLFTNSGDRETSTREINLKENSTDSKRSKIHWQTPAMNKPNGEQGSVTASIFKLLFMRTDVVLLLPIKRE